MSLSIALVVPCCALLVLRHRSVVTAPRCVMIIMWLADPVASRRPLPPFWVRVFAPWVCEEQFFWREYKDIHKFKRKYRSVPRRQDASVLVCDCVVVCESVRRVCGLLSRLSPPAAL